jgi:zinc protease
MRRLTNQGQTELTPTKLKPTKSKPTKLKPVNSRAFMIALIASLFFASAATFASARKLATAQDENWRKQPPQPGPARSFDLPAAREAKLENGLTLVMVEDRRAPMVTIIAGVSQAIGSSGASDADNRAALSEATAELLTEGAGGRTSERLAREVETLGGQISSFGNSDYAVLSAAVVSENAEAMMDIFADALLRPSFPQSEVALYKDNRIEKLALDRQEASFLLRERFNRIIYGAHPYGIIAPAPEAVRLLTRAKISRFYQTNYSPAGSVVVIVGDFDPAKIETKARRLFGAWKRPPSKTTKPNIWSPLRRSSQKVYLIDRPGSAQADFRIGNLAIARADADYFPLIVANAILGGDRTGSRLFLNLREQKGFTYDVFSAVSALKQGGTFFGGSETRAEVALPAIKEMLVEFDRLRNEKVSDEELRNAKSYLTGLFSLALSTQGGIADELLQMRLLDLGPDYLKNYRARIEAVTPDDVERVARARIQTDRPVIVVVGDAAKLKKEISKLGPLVVLDGKGNPKKQRQ